MSIHHAELTEITIHDTKPTAESAHLTISTAKLNEEWAEERRTNPTDEPDGGRAAFLERVRREIEEDSAHIKGLLNKIQHNEDFHLRVIEYIALFEYLYDHPKLIIHHLKCRSMVLNKMRDIEGDMLIEQLNMVSDLVTYDAVAMEQRKRMRSLCDLLDRLRETYWMEHSVPLSQ